MGWDGNCEGREQGVGALPASYIAEAAPTRRQTHVL